jgi:hypothetical protein
MAVPTNTHSTYDMAGIREQLADKISSVDNTETPMFSMAGTEKAEARSFDWQTDALPAVDDTNANIPGNDFSGSAVSATARVKNYCQFVTKEYTLSDDADAVKTAGRARETVYNTMKFGLALRRDVEAIMLKNQASVVGSESVAPKTAGVLTWIETNTDRGATGADGGYNSGTGIVDAATNGTQRAYTTIETIVNGLMQTAFTNGAKPSVLMSNAFGKREMSANMTGIATLYRDANGSKQASVIGATDLYVSDFGELRIVPNAHMSTRDVLLLDPKAVKKCVLRNFQTEKMGKTGDNTKYMIKYDFGVKVLNEKSLGVAADMNAS